MTQKLTSTAPSTILTVFILFSSLPLLLLLLLLLSPWIVGVVQPDASSGLVQPR